MAAKKRGNGQGTAYKENGTWRACIVLGYEPVEMPDGTVRMIVHRKRKRGFPTKSAALAYCESLRKQSLQIRLLNFLDLYKEWESGYAGRVSKSTIQLRKRCIRVPKSRICCGSRTSSRIPGKEKTKASNRPDNGSNPGGNRGSNRTRFDKTR